MTESRTAPDHPTQPHPPALIDGVRVVELCDARAGRVAAAFTGKLLAGFGADVVKIEPPGGDASRREGPFAGNVPSAETSATFLHYNTVDEVALILAAKGAPAAYLRSGMLFVGPNEHIVPGFAKGQTNDFFLMFAVQRQSTDSEQIENVTFFCFECQSELYRHKYSASELECAYRFAPAATVQGALDAALAYNADSALQTCNSCGHVNPTFSHRLWGWENQVRGSKLSQLGWDMFEEATRAI